MDPKYCPHANCFNARTPATHFGLCAEHFMRLSGRQRRQLMNASGWVPPDHNRVIYVPTPRLRWAYLAATALGAVAGYLAAGLPRAW